MNDPIENQFVTHHEFGEFKRADAEWKKSVSHDIKNLIGSFNDYKTYQSKEQNWRSMLPIVSVMILIGGLVVTPLYASLTSVDHDIKDLQRVMQESIPDGAAQNAEFRARINALEEDVRQGN